MYRSRSKATGLLSACEIRAQVIAEKDLCESATDSAGESSRADKAITRRLAEALLLVDVRMLDHSVVATGKCVSFLERGLVHSPILH